MIKLIFKNSFTMKRALMVLAVLIMTFTGCYKDNDNGRKSTTGTLNGHEWIDLGLPSGTLWATTNVGADTPEAYGDYFAWGEPQPQASNEYSWECYKYAGSDYDKFTKYCSESSYGDNGYTDTLVRLLPEDDAATANWGNGWRMPTSEELEELIEKCVVMNITQNGVKGRIFIAPGGGKSIFLPAAGNRCYYGNFGNNDIGGYWSSSLDILSPHYAMYLFFNSDSDNCRWGSYNRYYGFSVRPVCASQK